MESTHGRREEVWEEVCMLEQSLVSGHDFHGSGKSLKGSLVLRTHIWVSSLFLGLKGEEELDSGSTMSTG